MLTSTTSPNTRALTVIFLLAGMVHCGSDFSGGEESGGAAGMEAGTATGGSAGSSGQGGGAAGTGGQAGGNDGGSSGTGGDAGTIVGQDSGTTCPLAAPKVGGACSPGAFCSYGGGICCGAAYRCSDNGTWEIIAADCACIVPVEAGSSADAGSSEVDAAGSSDASGGSCADVKTVQACDARSDCHSVFLDPGTCGCPAVGCCAHFERCADGKKARCTGPVACKVAEPFCEGPYVISYTGICYEGCVRATDCAQ